MFEKESDRISGTNQVLLQESWGEALVAYTWMRLSLEVISTQGQDIDSEVELTRFTDGLDMTH